MPPLVHHVLFGLDMGVGELITGIVETVGVQRQDRTVAVDPRNAGTALLRYVEHACKPIHPHHRHIGEPTAIRGQLLARSASDIQDTHR